MRVADEDDLRPIHLLSLNQFLDIGDYPARVVAAVEIVAWFHETHHHVDHEDDVAHDPLRMTDALLGSISDSHISAPHAIPQHTRHERQLYQFGGCTSLTRFRSAGVPPAIVRPEPGLS